MRINPCHGCPVRDGCALRDEFRQRARGIGARSVTFHCPRLAEEFRPGRRVLVPTPRLKDMGSCYEPDYRVEMVAVPATVTGYRNAEFSCVIDPGHVYGNLDEDGERGAADDKFRFRRAMRVQRVVRFLDEPDRARCKHGRVALPDGDCDKPPGEDCYCETERSMRLAP